MAIRVDSRRFRSFSMIQMCIRDRFQIIMGIEEEFDIEIPNEEAEKIVTVGDAVEQIKNCLLYTSRCV